MGNTITLEPKILSLGFIGLGWIGRDRMKALLENNRIKAVAISEPDTENAMEALKLADDINPSTSSEIYSDPTIDGVVIATPSAGHAEQSIAALRAGKAVFCQKPLGRTAAEVKKVMAASFNADKLLAVDMSYRHTSAFGAIYELIQKGGIGQVFSAKLVFHNAYGPDKDWFYDLQQSGGGCMMDLGIHLVDLALWTLNFPDITEVKSYLFHKGKRLYEFDGAVEDFAKASLTTKNGICIDIECSWNLDAGKDAVIEAEFFGTEGGACFRNIDGSFYDFTAEKYKGTETVTLVSPPDAWNGRAGTEWAEKVLNGQGFDLRSATELIRTADIIDRIYGR